MPFGFLSADIMPRIKYNAQSGRVFRVDRVQISGKWESEDVDITDTLLMLVDRSQIQQGWANFTKFDRILVDYGQDLPERPDTINSEGKPAYQPFVSLIVKLGPKCGGDVRELSGTSMTLINSLGELIDSWADGEEANIPDMCPVVRLVGTQAFKNPANNSKLYAPKFATVGWRPRPADLVKQVTTNVSTQTDEDFPEWDPPVPEPVDEPTTESTSQNDITDDYLPF